ncbi:GrpB family protein [Mycolicibacterium nivoides]|uniref:GrpB family protein n=1 Tax=Mycolicibacterium nivoides TaxID=2487344 RepID=UPI003C2C2B4F
MHVVDRSGQLWAANVMFRDNLRSHLRASAEYARVKSAIARNVDGLLSYSPLKVAGVRQLMV